MDQLASLINISTLHKVDRSLLIRAAFQGGIYLYAFIQDCAMEVHFAGTTRPNELVHIKNRYLIIGPDAVENPLSIGVVRTAVKHFRDPEQPGAALYPTESGIKCTLPIHKLLLHVRTNEIEDLFTQLRRLPRGIYAGGEPSESDIAASGRFGTWTDETGLNPVMHVKALQYAGQEQARTGKIPKRKEIAEYLKENFVDYWEMNLLSIERHMGYPKIREKLKEK